MTGFLLDTNVVSEMVQRKPAPAVLEWMETADEATLYLSVLTIGEIRRGTAALPQSKRRTRLDAWLAADLRLRFAGRILPVDDAIADRWGYLLAQGQLRGRPAPVVDGLLAATALEHDLTVVTRNVRDFSGFGVPVLNPWGRGGAAR